MGRTLTRTRAVAPTSLRAFVGEPRSGSLLRLDELALVDPDAVLPRLGGCWGGAADRAGVVLAGLANSAVLSVTLPPLLLERRLPRVGLHGIQLRAEHDEAGFDQVWTGDRRFWVLPSDPSVDHADAYPVADRTVLATLLVEQLLDCLGPLFTAFHVRLPVDGSSMWCQTVDVIHSLTQWLGRQTATPPEGAWSIATALAEQLARRQPLAPARRRPCGPPTVGSGGRALALRRGCAQGSSVHLVESLHQTGVSWPATHHDDHCQEVAQPVEEAGLP